MTKRIWLLSLALAPCWPVVCPAQDLDPQPTRQINVYAYRDAPVSRSYFYSASGNSQRLLAFRKRLIASGAHKVNFFWPNVVTCELPVDENLAELLDDPDIRFEPGLAPQKAAGGIEAVEGEVYSLRWVQSLCAVADRVLGATSPAIRDDAGVPPASDELMTPPATEGDTEAPPSIEDDTELSPASDVLMAPPEAVTRTQEAVAMAPAAAAAGAAAAPRNMLQNSEILIGDILVQMIFPESSPNPSHTETWTDASLAQAEVQSTFAMLYFQEHFDDLPINLVFKKFPRAHTNTEPITYVQGAEATWVSDVMFNLGYSDDPALYLDEVHKLNEAGRAEVGSDWVFTAFVINAQNDEDHMFADGAYPGWVYLGGPYMVVAFPPGVSGKRGDLSFLERFKHEVGHIFWALEEDRFDNKHECFDRSGYLNFEHGNKVFKAQWIFGMWVRQGCGDYGGVVPCLMNMLWQGDPCWYTLGMFGLVDQDINNVPDALDVAPRVTFENSAVETVTTDHKTVRFRVASQGVPNRNPFQNPGERVRYRLPIKQVARSENGVVTQRLRPVDGQLDELVEDFEFDIGPLRPGLTELGVTTQNTANSREEFVKEIQYLGLAFVHFAFDLNATPDGDVENRITWNMLGDTYGATFDLHRVDESAGVDEVVGADLTPKGPREGPFTPYGYTDTDLDPGQKYRYYVSGEFTVPYQGQTQTFVNKSTEHEVTAMIPIASQQLLSNVSPNPFRDVAYISVDVPVTYAHADKATKFLEPVPTPVAVSVYDVAGRLVKKLHNNRMYARPLTVSWDGTDRNGRKVPSGIYFIKATAGDFSAVRKVVLIR